ncbi:hypothetical protein B0G62_102550 [Paraburkholderia eburnea]|uniref:Uncharacterized protein n=1 Tax=Paraburkholderia eburnea TaxID=1189126 RepID=A0A2S4MJL4_9BURK|nr:hypothetical protein B0G62_102550 [Paraburkholderia eburnea]PRZ24461.1 hypothetical protein BX588_103180 [Paraburkholderia eburnea]
METCLGMYNGWQICVTVELQPDREGRPWYYIVLPVTFREFATDAPKQSITVAHTGRPFSDIDRAFSAAFSDCARAIERTLIVQDAESTLKNDQNLTPHYLVFRSGGQPYVLNSDLRILRREASSLLRSFARSRAAPISIGDEMWNEFSDSESILLAERDEIRAYSLISGNETEHQLRLLTSL